VFLKRYKRSKIIVAAVLLVCALSAGAWAGAASLTSNVTALQDANIGFIFDGQRKDLPPGYTVLNYQNHTYVPTRFVAESLGAKVEWDALTKLIRITPGLSPADYQALKKEKDELEALVKEKDEKIAALEAEIKRIGGGESANQPTAPGNYQKIPLSRTLPGMLVMITGIIEDTIFKHNRVYIELENRDLDTPIQLLQVESKATVDGKVYTSKDAMQHFAGDQKWYHDVRKEERVSGYILMPKFPEGSKEMLLELTILYNDADQKTVKVEFAIRLD